MCQSTGSSVDIGNSAPGAVLTDDQLKLGNVEREVHKNCMKKYSLD